MQRHVGNRVMPDTLAGATVAGRKACLDVFRKPECKLSWYLSHIYLRRI